MSPATPLKPTEADVKAAEAWIRERVINGHTINGIVGRKAYLAGVLAERAANQTEIAALEERIDDLCGELALYGGGLE